MATIAEPMLLPDDVVLVPVDDLPDEVRSELDHRPGDHALTRPMSRTPSSIVDARTARLLESFRTPSRIVDAVIQYAAAEDLDPRETLERAYPVLRDLLGSGYLVPADSDLATPIASTVLAEGERIGRFEVVRGVQAMIDTQVCLARDTVDDGFVALKVGRPGSGADGAFRHEAAILARLEGHGAPALLDVGDDAGRPFLAMAWQSGVDGETAAGTLRRARSERRGLLELGERVLGAYAAIHARGVLHGDVHPANVVVGADDDVTVIDFGLAVAPGDVGIPRGGVDFFQEPESVVAQEDGLGSTPLTAAGEQYGVAALLYRLLTGAYTHAFALEPVAMRRQLAEDPPIPFATHGVDDLPAVEGVVRRGLAKDPADRHVDLAAFLDAYRTAMASDLAAPGEAVALARRDTVLREHVDVVAERVGLDGPLLRASLEPPTASVNLGAAGIADALRRIAAARDDETILALADLWSIKARAAIGAPEAFENAELEITPAEFGTTGIHHSATGVHLVAAGLAAARSDVLGWLEAAALMLDAIADPGVHRDVSFGRSGILVGLASLLESAPPTPTGEPELDRAIGDITANARRAGDAVADGLWAELPATIDATIGVAHGWAGYAYGRLRWSAASGTPVAPAVLDALDQLARLATPNGRGLAWPRAIGEPDDGSLMATWCNGAAGHAGLWALVARLGLDDRAPRLAEGAAWTAVDGPPVPGDLCCGLAGRAYAALDVYQLTGEHAWLDRARDLGEGAVASVADYALRRDSLYKGDIGVAVLAAELARPEEAAMPLFGPGTGARPITA